MITNDEKEALKKYAEILVRKQFCHFDAAGRVRLEPYHSYISCGEMSDIQDEVDEFLTSNNLMSTDIAVALCERSKKQFVSQLIQEISKTQFVVSSFGHGVYYFVSDNYNHADGYKFGAWGCNAQLSEQQKSIYKDIIHDKTIYICHESNLQTIVWFARWLRKEQFEQEFCHHHFKKMIKQNACRTIHNPNGTDEV